MASNPYPDYGLLWRALAVSLLLHVVLLLQPGFGSVVVARASVAQSLNALLKPGTTSATTSRLPAPLASPAAPAHRQAPLARPTLVASDDAVAGMHDKTSGAQSPAAVAASDPAGGGSAAASAAVDIGEDRKSYLLAIAAEARRVKKYPPRALAAGWTGTAEVRIAVVGGTAQTPQLSRSSGYPDIDSAALSLVGYAVKRTPMPETLRSRNFDLVLPIVFAIEDE